MRLARGSGVSGLTCMRSSPSTSQTDNALRVVRPLLGVARADIIRYVVQEGLPFALVCVCYDLRFW